MGRFKRWVARTSRIFVAVGVFFAIAANGVTIASGATYEGPSVPMGKGTARIVVRTDNAGEPLAVAVKLSRDALSGLPTTLNPATAEGQWEYPLPMPAEAAKTGYQHVVIDWQPHGHPPPHVYTVPHFDFHFYMIGPAEVAQVAFTGPSDPATKVSDATLIPAGYEVIPETAVDKMGVHAVNTAAPEFRGAPFTATFIYGYDRGRLIFVEPMVARDFLLSKPNLTLPVTTPARYSLRGYYPTKYGVRYDVHAQAYFVELGGLTQSGGAASAQLLKR